MHNIFLAFTPYHVLLSCAIALQECDDAYNHLIIRPSFSHAPMLTTVLSDWKGSPFDRVTCIRGLHGVSSEGLKRFILKTNSLVIRGIVKSQLVDKVYVGSDGSPESQTALHFAKSSNFNAKGIYIEDGSAAYSTAQFPKREQWKESLEKIFYGNWWEYIRVHGTSKWVDEVRLVYPEFARPELADKILKRIERKKILRLQKEPWPAKYLSAMGVDRVILNSIDGLLLLPRSTLLGGTSRLNSVVDKFADYAVKRGQKIGVKCHPRDFAHKVVTKGKDKHVLILPNAIPVELIYLYGTGRLKLVTAGVSTSLLTAHWLIDAAKIICIKTFSGFPDGRIINIFRTLGIELATTVDEIGSLTI